MKIRKTWGAVLGASALLALAACGGSSDSNGSDEAAT
ncbi:MAG: GDSL family lipase, partial [Actinobacteria bacterium]|nr:GDSL family lipase [Actinomycetota bacterium]